MRAVASRVDAEFDSAHGWMRWPDSDATPHVWLLCPAAEECESLSPPCAHLGEDCGTCGV